MAANLQVYRFLGNNPRYREGNLTTAYFPFIESMLISQHKQDLVVSAFIRNIDADVVEPWWRQMNDPVGRGVLAAKQGEFQP